MIYTYIYLLKITNRFFVIIQLYTFFKQKKKTLRIQTMKVFFLLFFDSFVGLYLYFLFSAKNAEDNRGENSIRLENNGKNE